MRQRFIDRLIPNRLPSQPGRIALTHLLNENGRIDVEATIVQDGTDHRFYSDLRRILSSSACWIYFNMRIRDDETS